MKRDVINGFEHLIFEESEVEQARAMRASGKDRWHVRIATTCAECSEYVETDIEGWDNQTEEPIIHSENYHQSLYRD